MCGLFGVIAFDQQVSIDIQKARSARDTLIHRGPNQAGEWVDKSKYIGHRRLSILDLSEAGRQPMASADNKVVISVNGEIYNFQPLRKELEERGECFRSKSDSEVILHGYRAWGIEALLDKIDGMYALAILDNEHGLLYLARDRVGIKPLYYSRLNDELAWASELKAIVAYYGKESLARDHEALYDFLTYRYIPAPKSAYKDVYKLPPAHYLRLDLGSGEVLTKRYWGLSTDTRTIDDDNAAQEVRSAMATAVSEHLVSDVPVGFFLSGGLDSSIVTAQARQLKYPAYTYSIGFGVVGFDETDYAEHVAEYLGTEHSTTIIDPYLEIPFVEWLEQIFDEPFGDNSALPTWYVASRSAERAVVVLTGDGGDELFGGYNWYSGFESTLAWSRWLKYIPESVSLLSTRKAKSLSNLVVASKTNMPELALHNSRNLSPLHIRLREGWRHLLQIDDDYDDMWFFKKFWRPGLGARKSYQYLDFHTFLPECVLTKVDRTTMAHSIEARVPFLSRDVVELAFSLPESFIYKNGQLKGGLKYAYRDLLPQSILNRGKKGFSLPWHKWGNILIHGDTLQEASLESFLTMKYEAA